MNPLHKLYEHHSKAIKVILSCETLDQLDVAREYCIIAINFHVKSVNGSYGSYRDSYIKMIRESESFMNEALKDHRNRLFRINRSKM